MSAIRVAPSVCRRTGNEFVVSNRKTSQHRTGHSWNNSRLLPESNRRWASRARRVSETKTRAAETDAKDSFEEFQKALSDAAGEDTFQNDFQQDANYPDVDLSDFDPPPPVKGGGVLLRVVAFSLAAWCHALAPLGGKWGAGATANGFTGVSLFATPLQWFGVAFITSALVSGVFCRFMNRKRLFQPIREEGPSSHKDSRTKTKTPTAGGVAFVPAGCLVALFFTKCGDPAVNAVVAVTLAFLAIGAVDDFGKLKAGANDSGLKPRVKFTAQCAAATAFVCLLYFLSTAGIIRETSTTVSFGFGFVMDFVAQMVFGATRVGSRSGVVQDVFLPLGGFLFYALSAFAIVAESNAVNVTDGVDGLASSLCAIAFVGLGVVCLAGGAASLGAFAIAMAGASCGFLVINRHPAAMFMGDAGACFPPNPFRLRDCPYSSCVLRRERYDQKGAFPEDGTTTVYVLPIPDIHAVRETDTFFFSIRVPFPGRGARRHRRRVWRRRDVSAFRQYPRVRRRGRFRDTSGGVVQDN